MADVTIADHGSITLMRPETEAARAWMDEHIPDDAQWFGGALAVEPRYALPIMEGMCAAGLGLS